MLRTTRWSPDTCTCVVDYQWDDAQSEDVRTHTIVNIVSTCIPHQGKTVNQLQNILFDENPRKNKVLIRAALQFPAFFPTTTIDGKTRVDYSAFSYFWDANRVLNVTIQGLTATQKAQLQTQIDSIIGAGKVLIL